MLGYLDLADASGTAVRFHGDGAASRRVTKVQGLPGLGSAGPRSSSYDAPSRHGSVTRSRWLKPAIVTIEGLLNGASSAETQAQYDALAIPLLDAVDTGALLTWQRPDGVELQAVARLEADINVDVLSYKAWRYQAHLRLDDPRGYGQDLLTATGGTLASGGGDMFPDIFPDTFDPATTGTAIVNNTGTRPTPAVFRVYGYATTAQVLLVGTDQRIALTGAVAPGDYLEVDAKERTVKLNGTSPAQGQVDSANTDWFDLPRGASTIRLLAGANDAITRVDVLYRPAYA